jgi:MFS family permease
MADAHGPRWEKSYPAHVVLVVLTLFPGLINTSAIGLAAPVIGDALGVAPAAAAALPLISDAALAFGCVVGAELARRFEGRALFFWALGASLVTSLVSALAPSFAVLIAAHITHGLVAGMLYVIALPPLLVNFKSDRLSATASVLVPVLFGAATLGPVIGGLVAAPVIWRMLFAAEVVVAAVALVLANQVLGRREPPHTDEPVDWFALLTAGIGSLLIYLGIGGLAGRDLNDPVASVPFIVGLAMYGVLIIGEARKEHPLFPVRKLATSLALIGAIATVVGSAAFSALAQCFSLTLLRVEELEPRAVGLAFWPEFFAALVSGYIFGRLVTTKWVVLTGAAGLAFIALAAALGRAYAPLDATSVGVLSSIGAFGAGLSVSPGLFVVTLSFERRLVARAIALLNLFRLTGGFISAPGVEHTIGSHAQDHLEQLDASRAPALQEVVRHFVTGAHLPPNAPIDLLKRALILRSTTRT